MIYILALSVRKRPLTFLSDLIPVQLSPLSIPLVLFRMGAMLLGVEPGRCLTGGRIPKKKSRYDLSMGQMAGRSQRPTKLASREWRSSVTLRGGTEEVYMSVHLHVNWKGGRGGQRREEVGWLRCEDAQRSYPPITSWWSSWLLFSTAVSTLREG